MKKIRKVLCLAVALLLCGLGAQAQFRAGIRAGVTINKLHLSDLGANFNSDNRCGFTGGVMAEFTIPVVGICFDASLMYSRMNSQVDGYYYNDESGALRNDFENSAKDFLQIPINIKYKIGLPVHLHRSRLCLPPGQQRLLQALPGRLGPGRWRRAAAPSTDRRRILLGHEQRGKEDLGRRQDRRLQDPQ